MRLLGRTSSINVRKVLWTAREIGLVFDHDDAWGTPEKSTRDPSFLAMNPNGLVPVWLDDAGAFWESNTICRYLASRHRRSDLLPEDPRDRARVERWMDWAAGDLNKAWRYPFMALGRGDPGFSNAQEIARGLEDWNRLMTVLDKHLGSDSPYMCGERFSLADVVVGLAAHRWAQTPMNHPHLRHVLAYLERLRRRRIFAELATDRLP